MHKPFITLKSPSIFHILPEVAVDSMDPTVPRCRRCGVRVSAPLRRGAAPYADASGCSQRSSHLICNEP